ncbi:MAG: protein kinase [Myxococcales bacterium]|nr:protein kinase [Myxococcales bacterium]
MSEGDPGKAATLPGGHGAPAGTVASLVGVGETIDAHGETVAPGPHETPLEGHAATLPGPGVVTDLAALPTVDAASYAIGPELARGGMGKILSARDRRLRRDVVIKVTRHEGQRIDPRFEREALITARLQHPSIVRVYEAGVLGDGRAFYAMERVRGRSLEVVLEETKTLEERIALLPHAIAVADAIAYAHSEGVLHRDLKPSNVLIGPFGETVVIDWGLAKDLRAVEAPHRPDTPVPEESGSSSDSSLTHAGAVLGTPSYMAPEQARGDAVDERTDIYALGTLLYTLLSGTPPYRGHSTDEVIEAVSNGRRRPIAEREPRVPPELATIVEHAMELDPADRYQSAKQLADELRQFAAGKLVASHEYGLWELLKRWVWRHRITVGVSLFAAIVLVVVLVLSFRTLKVAKEEAEIAQIKAERATDKVLLDQAKAMLDVDPSRAAAWLRKASDQALAEPRAHEIAVDAARLGLARALVGHGNDVEHVIVSPDDTHAATGSDDGTARWWDLDKGTSIALKGHVGPIETMTMSADGTHLATAGTDHDVWLWELAAGTGRKLSGHGATVRGVAFSPDGAQLASTSEDGTFWLWDVASGKGRELVHHTHGLRAVTWTRDGKTLLVGGYDGVIIRIDPLTGASRLQQAHAAELRTLVVSPDNTLLAAGDEDGIATLWTIEGKRLRTLGSHIDVCRKLVFTPDGKHLASAGGDELVHVYAIPEGPTIDLEGNLAGIKDMDISADGAWVASAGIDTTVWVWPITGGKGRRFTGHPNAVKAVGFTRDGRIISGSEDDTARIWRLDVEEPPEGPPLRAWLFAHSNVDIR